MKDYSKLAKKLYVLFLKKYQAFTKQFSLKSRCLIAFGITFLVLVWVWYATSGTPSWDVYCKLDNVLTGNFRDYNRISLILHASYDRINGSLIRQVESWDGPVSLAIVFPHKTSVQLVRCVTELIHKLTEDSPEAKSRLSVHYLIMGQKHCHADFRLPVDFNTESCDTLLGNMEETSMDKAIQYPINIARNYARNKTMTKYIIMTDLDIYFSRGFEQKMLHLADETLKPNDHIVLVSRLFEIDGEAFRIKETKENLRQLIKTDQAVEFHKHLHPGHSIPHLDNWLASPEAVTPTIQFFNPYDNPDWEPQFVSLQNIPYHSEVFRYPLRDNAILRWEMCRTGYAFAIVNDVFMYHPWIRKPMEGENFGAARSAVRKENSKAYQAFLKRMDKEFPETANKCPVVEQL